MYDKIVADLFCVVLTELSSLYMLLEHLPEGRKIFFNQIAVELSSEFISKTESNSIALVQVILKTVKYVVSKFFSTSSKINARLFSEFATV